MKLLSAFLFPTSFIPSSLFHPLHPHFHRPQPSPSLPSHPSKTQTPQMQQTPHHDLIIEARVQYWARTIVPRLNLCPFASQVLNSHRVRTTITHASTESDLFVTFNNEARRLMRTPEEQLATTLLVAPQFAKGDFARFYKFERFLEKYLKKSEEEEDGVGNRVMVACFHPKYMYGNVEGAVCFDKRAPYSVINLLRVEMVDQVVEEGRTVGILERNQEVLEKIGVERLKVLYENLNWEEAFEGIEDPSHIDLG